MFLYYYTHIDNCDYCNVSIVNTISVARRDEGLREREAQQPEPGEGVGGGVDAAPDLHSPVLSHAGRGHLRHGGRAVVRHQRRRHVLRDGQGAGQPGGPDQSQPGITDT